MTTSTDFFFDVSVLYGDKRLSYLRKWLTAVSIIEGIIVCFGIGVIMWTVHSNSTLFFVFQGQRFFLWPATLAASLFWFTPTTLNVIFYIYIASITLGTTSLIWRSIDIGDGTANPRNWAVIQLVVDVLLLSICIAQLVVVFLTWERTKVAIRQYVKENISVNTQIR